MLPSLPPSDSNQENQDEAHAKAGKQEDEIPSPEELRKKMWNLNGLVMLNLISLPKANFFQRNLKNLHDAQSHRGRDEQGSLNLEDLLEACRRDPKMLDLIKSQLSDDQIRWLMERITRTNS